MVGPAALSSWITPFRIPPEATSAPPPPSSPVPQISATGVLSALHRASHLETGVPQRSDTRPAAKISPLPLLVWKCMLLSLAWVGRLSSLPSSGSLARVGRARARPLFSGPVVLEPEDFGVGFQMPVRGEELFALENANIHPLDERIAFDEEAHKYAWEGRPLPMSVTEVVGRYFEKFQPELAIHLMMKGPNWPRPAYTTPEGRPFTPKEIRLSWDETGEQARNRGTWMHSNIERVLNHLPSSDLPEMSQFRDFQREVILARNITPFRTEWRIAAPDIGLGGSVDFVGRLPGGGFVLMDWKRSKNIPTSMTQHYGKYGKTPVQHLPDCDGSKYSLQLNLYRYILRRYYRVQVQQMFLASFHPELDGYFLAEIPIMDKEIADIVVQLGNGSGSSSKGKDSSGSGNGSIGVKKDSSSKSKSSSGSSSKSSR